MRVQRSWAIANAALCASSTSYSAKKTPDEQVLQVGKLVGVVVHGSGAITRQLQQGVVVRDKERGGGDGEGKQPAGRIGTRHGEPRTVAVPLPR